MPPGWITLRQAMAEAEMSRARRAGLDSLADCAAAIKRIDQPKEKTDERRLPDDRS